jgi:hypothetical protein
VQGWRSRPGGRQQDGTAAPSAAGPRLVAPRRGWPGAGAGRAPHVDAGAVYLATTSQVAGLYPWVLGASLPPEGVPLGPDLLTNELVCFDPAGWVGRLVQNPGVWIMAQPGSGKSAIAKRICLAYAAYGARVLVPGDVKGEYAPLIRDLGGQVVRVGRGLDKINPLDSGPLRRRLGDLPAAQQAALAAEITGRRADLLQALLATPHGLGRRPNASEANVVNHVVGLVAEQLPGDPVIPDVVTALREGPAQLWSRLLVDTLDDYRDLVREVVLALENLCSGPLAGLFDGPTTTPLDLDAPALSVDLSGLLTAGDQVVAAGMLSTWAYAYTSIDSARALGMMTDQLVLPLDEMWRALRAGPGMVDAMDSMTRLNRSKSEVSLMITHSLRDTEALPTPEDRAKALGLMERCDCLILGALSAGELDRVAEQKPLTSGERELVASWASPTVTGLDGTTQRHPGRGKYLIKIGARAGTPVRLDLTPAELRLYDTDPATPARRGALSPAPPPGEPAAGQEGIT